MSEENKKPSEIANGIILNLVSHRYCQGDLDKLKHDKEACYLCLYLGLMIPQADESAMTEIMDAVELEGLSPEPVLDEIIKNIEENSSLLPKFNDCRETIEMVLSTYYRF